MIKLEEIGRMVPARSTGKQAVPLVLDRPERRLVRLELNTAAPCRLQLETANDIRFLANVTGRETLTFIADGPCAVHWLSDDEVWWFTPEMEAAGVTVEDPEVYTKMFQRQARNPELERIARKMQQNAERREAALLQEVRGVVEGLRQQNETLKEEVKRGKRKSAAPTAAPAADEPPNPAGPPETPEGADGGGGDDGDE